jgi:hypothetical protein
VLREAAKVAPGTEVETRLQKGTFVSTCEAEIHTTPRKTFEVVNKRAAALAYRGTKYLVAELQAIHCVMARARTRPHPLQEVRSNEPSPGRSSACRYLAKSPLQKLAGRLGTSLRLCWRSSPLRNRRPHQQYQGCSRPRTRNGKEPTPKITGRRERARPRHRFDVVANQSSSSSPAMRECALHLIRIPQPRCAFWACVHVLAH